MQSYMVYANYLQDNDCHDCGEARTVDSWMNRQGLSSLSSPCHQPPNRVHPQLVSAATSLISSLFAHHSILTSHDPVAAGRAESQCEQIFGQALHRRRIPSVHVRVVRQPRPQSPQWRRRIRIRERRYFAT